MNKLILHLEDDYNVKASFRLVFSKLPEYKLMQFDTPSDVENILYEKAYVIISDYDMFDETAIKMLQYLKDHNIKTPVIMHSGNQENYYKIKDLGLDTSIIFWADKTESLKNIIIMIKNLK